MEMIRVKVGLSEETLARVDAVRGLVPRERWVRQAIEAALEPRPPGVPVAPSAIVEVSEGQTVVKRLPPVKGGRSDCLHKNQHRKFGITICGDCGARL